MWAIPLFILLLLNVITFRSIHGISHVPVLTYNGSCIYFNETFGGNKTEVMTASPCEQLICDLQKKEVVVTGCPPPQHYSDYMKDKTRYLNPNLPWPWCCPSLKSTS
uniref:Single domain-containing protein n=1 Tax=Amblyomma triste TaxID=251400 RepID=A0A023G6P6_AMBTT